MIRQIRVLNDAEQLLIFSTSFFFSRGPVSSESHQCVIQFCVGTGCDALELVQRIWAKWAFDVFDRLVGVGMCLSKVCIFIVALCCVHHCGVWQYLV